MADDRSAFRARVRGVYALVIFGAAFGYVEAAVVYDLRHILGALSPIVPTSYHTILNLGFITFIRPDRSLLATSAIGRVETVREAATIVMLVAIAWLAAHRWTRRLGAFLIAFGTWDLTYYLWLRVILHWPASLLTRDIFFLIPVPWIGPVLTPLVISLLLVLGGVRLYLRPETT